MSLTLSYISQVQVIPIQLEFTIFYFVTTTTGIFFTKIDQWLLIVELPGHLGGAMGSRCMVVGNCACVPSSAR